MTTALEGDEGQRHAPAAFYPRERPGTHCTGDWVGPRVGVDRCGKSRPPPTGIRSPDSPARSQSLYQLSYLSHRRTKISNGDKYLDYGLLCCDTMQCCKQVVIPEDFAAYILSVEQTYLNATCQYIPPRYWYTSTKLQGVTCQNSKT